MISSHAKKQEVSLFTFKRVFLGDVTKHPWEKKLEELSASWARM